MLVVWFFTQRGVGSGCEFIDIVRAILGEGMSFRAGPEVFHRVQFRCVGGKVFNVDIGCIRRIIANPMRTMGLQPIPQDDQRPSKMTPHLPQHGHDQRFVNRRIGLQQMVTTEPPPSRRERQQADRRDFPPAFGVVMQNGCLPLGCPRAADNRQHQEAAFVPKYERGVQSPRFFLMRGQSRRLQCAMASSSRSRARRTGFCGETFKAFINSGT